MVPRLRESSLYPQEEEFSQPFSFLVGPGRARIQKATSIQCRLLTK